MASSFIDILILFGVTYLLYQFYRIIRLVWKLRIIGKAVDQFPMDDKHWLKGHLDKLSGQGEEGLSYFSELMKKYPKACGIYFINFLKPHVMVYHPDTMKVVMKAASRKPAFLGIGHFGRKWLGDGVLTANGEKWQRNRKLLTPTFHVEALKRYIKAFNLGTDVFLENISTLIGKNESFEMHDLASKLTLDIILRNSFSFESGLQTKSEEYFYIKAVREMTRLWMKRYYEPWNYFDFIYWRTDDGKKFLKYADSVCDFATALIKKRRNLLEKFPEESMKYYDFLDLLMRSKDEDGFGLTDDDIKFEINDFIFAGFDTTSSAISWALYNLALNPEHQKICQKEIDDLLNSRPDDNLDWDDLQELPYLTMCMKESMRLCGPPFIEKELEEDVMLDGKLVPAGTVIGINLYNLHHHPEIWETPLEFHPERFTKENSIERDAYSYLPFSTGPRNCLGQAFALAEIKLVLARTLRRFTFSVKKNFTPIKMMSLILMSSNGIHLKASPRKE